MIELLSVAKVFLCSKAVSAILGNLIASAVYDGGKYALSKLFNRGSAEIEYDRKLKSAFYRAVALTTKNTTIRKHIQERDLSKYHDLLIEDLKGNLSEEGSLKGRYFKDILKEFKAQLLKDPQFGNHIIELYGKECIKQLAEINSQLNIIIDQNNQVKDLILELKDKLSNNPNNTIREITNKLDGLIQSLHIKTAYDQLNALRELITENDKETLALIDYNRGLCSKYVDSKRASNEFSLAYEEMSIAGKALPAIIGGKIYSHIIEENKTDALSLAEELKKLSYSNIWGWIPGLVYAEDLNMAYKALPATIKQDESVIATAIHYLKDFGTFISISEMGSYSINPLNTITLDNIPQWLLHISISTTRYFSNWLGNIHLIKDNEEAPYKELHTITSEYIRLINKTELPDLASNVKFINKICEYHSTKNIHLIEEIKTAPYQPNMKLIHHQSYAALQREVGNLEEAKSYLNDYGDGLESSTINLQLLLAVETSDPEYAANTIQTAVNNGIVIHDHHIPLVLTCMHYFGSTIGPKIYDVKIQDETQISVFLEVCKFYLDTNVNIELLNKLEEKSSIFYKPYIALIYHKYGLTQRGIELMRSCIDDSKIDFRSMVYIELLLSDNAYNVELYRYLNKLRSLGYIEDQYLLSKEYELAAIINDFPVMKETSKILYEQNPENGNILASYMVALSELGETEIIQQLYKTSKNIISDDISANNVFTVLLRAKLYREAVDFLYTYIKRQEHPSETICMTYHQSSFIKSTQPIIHEEYETVFEGAFVYYTFNGESKKDIIQKDTRLECMIGKRVDDVIELDNLLGKKDTIVINRINNKYHKLIIDIYKDIMDAKFKSAFSFKIDDLTDGDGILANMSKIAGNTPESRLKHEQNLKDYRKGDLTLGCFIKETDYITGYYNTIFGDFDVYCFTHQDFTSLYEAKKHSLDSHPIVLDLTSLILLHDISVKMQLEKLADYIIAGSIKKYINDCIIREDYGCCDYLHPIVAERLSPIQTIENKSTLYAQLKNLLAWIDNNCTVEEVEEKLNVDIKITENSPYMSMVYDSVLLANKHKATLSIEDIALIKQLCNSMPITCVNTITQKYYPDQYEKVCQYFIERHIIGADISTEYLISEYTKFLNKENNSFNVCKLNLAFNHTVFNNTYELCKHILSKDLITQDSTLLVTTLLTEMFKLYDYKTSLMLCRNLCKVSSSEILKRCILDAFRIAHPIIR